MHLPLVEFAYDNSYHSMDEMVHVEVSYSRSVVPQFVVGLKWVKPIYQDMS